MKAITKPPVRQHRPLPLVALMSIVLAALATVGALLGLPPAASMLPWLMVAACSTILLLLLLSWLQRVCCRLQAWWQLHRHGPADLSHKLLQQSCDRIVTVDTAHCGRITYVGRADVASQVFHKSAFVNRLGSVCGLKLLGMHHQGIIWNNDTAGWEMKRKFFSEGIQGVVMVHHQHVKEVCIKAFKLTLAEQCHMAAAEDSSTDPVANLPPIHELAALPLSQLASAVAGLSLNLLPDGRDFLRLITFRVTAALTLGLPVDALDRQQALDVVYKVAAYFKAWEYFLLRPAWLCHLTRWTAKHQRHLQDIAALQSATADLITLAMEKLGTNSAGKPGTSSALPLDSTFIWRLLSARDAGQLSAAEVQQLVLEMLLAGTDTSSVSLYYLMVELQGNRLLEKDLRDEVLTAAGNITGLSDIHLAQKLDVTAGTDPSLLKCQAALCEAMRYKPVGPVVIRQAVQPVTLSYTTTAAADAGAERCSETLAKQQLHLKPGDTVIISLATMHRDSKVFPVPESFCPFSNFSQPLVSGSAGSSPTTQQPFAVTAAVTGSAASELFRPFGHGRKGCVGRELGWLEMNMILVCWQLTMRFRTPPVSKAASSGAAASDTAASSNSSSRGVGGSLLDAMNTKWEVASQPTNPIPLHVRCVHPAGPSRVAVVKKVYVVGPHGSGKTTLCKGLLSHLAAAGCGATDVVAPAPMGLSTTDDSTASATAADDSKEQQHQPGYKAAAVVSMVAVATESEGAASTHSKSAARLSTLELITETARDVMRQQGISRDMLTDPNIYLKLQHMIVDSQLLKEDIVGSRSFMSDRCVVDAIAYTADRFGFDSRQVKELLALPSSQALLKRCRSAEALVLLLPPFKEGPPVDDGTRLMTDMARLTAAFEAVLELQAVPYEVVTAADRFDRVKEVCGLLGMSTSGWPCI